MVIYEINNNTVTAKTEITGTTKKAIPPFSADGGLFLIPESCISALMDADGCTEAVALEKLGLIDERGE